ncbi:MAG: hypothetical protein QOG96_5708, partial [Pseudonocardiales bacterium]|nr:hypothetical protein [Pseudonocardiales bacterium]
MTVQDAASSESDTGLRADSILGK